MRKVIIFSLLIFIIIFNWPTAATSTHDDYSFQVIPDDAIRLRILANSDHEEDQRLKELIRDEVSEQISSWVEHMTDIEEARALIETRIPKLEQLITELLHKEHEEQSFEIDYQANVTFPAKLYDTVIYPAGEYEAVLITIGEGQGTNWWCVLFPPLCFLDFGHGATVDDSSKQESEQEDDEKDSGLKIKFFLFEWFGWA